MSCINIEKLFFRFLIKINIAAIHIFYFFLGGTFLGLFLFDFSNSSHFESSSNVLTQNPSNFIASVPISLLSSYLIRNKIYFYIYC